MQHFCIYEDLGKRYEIMLEIKFWCKVIRRTVIAKDYTRINYTKKNIYTLQNIKNDCTEM